MRYEEHYDRLIQRARHRAVVGYVEWHHVLPRCLGGDDSKDNLVPLTGREHYVAHQLLVKLYPGNLPLVRAANMMHVSPTGGRENNRTYGWLREKQAQVTSEMNRCRWADTNYRSAQIKRQKEFWSRPENIEAARAKALSKKDACSAGAKKANEVRWANHVKVVAEKKEPQRRGPQSQAARTAVAAAKKAWWAKRKAEGGYSEACLAISNGTKVAMSDPSVRSKISTSRRKSAQV